MNPTRANSSPGCHARFPANRKPRFEPRPKWPRGSLCARPWALVKGKPGVRIERDVEFQASRRHLPAVRLERAAQQTNAAMRSVLAIAVCACSAYQPLSTAVFFHIVKHLHGRNGNHMPDSP